MAGKLRRMRQKQGNPGLGVSTETRAGCCEAKERGYPAVRAMCQIMLAERIAHSP